MRYFVGRMKFSHSEEQRDGRQLDILTEEENGLRIIVSRLGAELISLARVDEAGNWIGFLYRDDDLSAPSQGWANHATVMGYYVHRLKNGRSLYRGHEIKGGTHGFLRSKTWHLTGYSTEGSGASLKYQITPEDFSPNEYPLKLSVELTYQIETNKVGVLFEFRNHEAELTAHVSFGLHPGFGATSFESFHLQMPRGCYRRYLSPDNFLSGQTRDIEFPGGEMPFLCVEPCWGLPDAHEQRTFEEKEGIQTIPPGGELRASFSITPQFASSD
jgi:galactose mutarotase-like enzyme